MAHFSKKRVRENLPWLIRWKLSFRVLVSRSSFHLFIPTHCWLLLILETFQKPRRSFQCHEHGESGWQQCSPLQIKMLAAKVVDFEHFCRQRNFGRTCSNIYAPLGLIKKGKTTESSVYFYTITTVDLSKIRTRIVRLESEPVDHHNGHIYSD